MDVTDVTAEARDVNGITVVCERIPFFQSVSFGIWVLAGSRNETDDNLGVSHFLEHLVFKGSDARTASDIAMEIDELGGNVEAFTTRENTCFGAHVVNQRLDKAFSLIAEIMLGSTFPQDEMELERRVILEELRAVDDSPADLAYEKLYQNRFPDHPLGRPIAGSPEAVLNVDRQNLFEFRDSHYAPPSIVVSAGGDITMEKLAALVETHFGHLTPGKAQPQPATPDPSPAEDFIHKEIEQAHMLVAGPGLCVTDKRRMTQMLLNTIFGGGVSSRLFQNIREKRGLAYSIHSFHDRFADCGVAGVYAACAPETLDEIWRITLEEMHILCSTKVDPKELARAKAQAQDNVRLSYESLDSRVSQMAAQMTYHRRFFSMEETLEQISSVTADQVRDLAGTIFGAPSSFTTLVVGPNSARRPTLAH
ncbi:MAG: insulinase family protein [Nitrospinota bacterium]|nr:insulinase family protein [Nitrospinota bacterium]